MAASAADMLADDAAAAWRHAATEAAWGAGSRGAGSACPWAGAGA